MIGGSSLSHRWYTFFIVIVFLYNKNSKVGNNLTNCYHNKYQAVTEVLVSEVWKKILFILSQFDWLDFVKKTLPKSATALISKALQGDWVKNHTAISALHWHILHLQIRRQQLKRHGHGDGVKTTCCTANISSERATVLFQLALRSFQRREQELRQPLGTSKDCTKPSLKAPHTHPWSRNWSYGSLKRNHGDIWPIRAECGNVLLHSQKWDV